MPTRKVSERERLTIYARTASDEQLEEALEILNIEIRIRKGGGRKVASKKAATKKPATVPPGPPNPPKPATDQPQG